MMKILSEKRLKKFGIVLILLGLLFSVVPLFFVEGVDTKEKLAAHMFDGDDMMVVLLEESIITVNLFFGFAPAGNKARQKTDQAGAAGSGRSLVDRNELSQFEEWIKGQGYSDATAMLFDPSYQKKLLDNYCRLTKEKLFTSLRQLMVDSKFYTKHVDADRQNMNVYFYMRRFLKFTAFPGITVPYKVFAGAGFVFALGGSAALIMARDIDSYYK